MKILTAAEAHKIATSDTREDHDSWADEWIAPVTEAVRRAASKGAIAIHLSSVNDALKVTGVQRRHGQLDALALKLEALGYVITRTQYRDALPPWPTRIGW